MLLSGTLYTGALKLAFAVRFQRLETAGDDSGQAIASLT